VHTAVTGESLSGGYSSPQNGRLVSSRGISSRDRGADRRSVSSHGAPAAAGRAAGTLASPRLSAALAVGRELAALVREAGRHPASLAMAFALLNPAVAAVLFGATRPEQVTANLAALSVAEELSPDERRRLTAIGAPAAGS